MLQQDLKKRIVLVGYLGHGKTTLLNKICNQNVKVYYGGKSSTRQVFLCKSSYGLGFELLDTPGLGSQEDRLAHVVGLYTALIDGPVHQILIVIKYERIDIMKGLLKKMLTQQFNRFRDIITVAVTFWDQAPDDQKNDDIKSMTEFLTSQNVLNVIFVSKQDQGDILCKMLDSILHKSIQMDDIYINQAQISETKKLQLELERKKREISLTEISSYFELLDLDDEILGKVGQAQGLLITQFRKKMKVSKEFIENFPTNNKLMGDVMHKLCLIIENMAKETIEEFQNKQVQLLNEIKANAQIKKVLSENIREIKQLASQKMKQSKSHFFNYIKQCPNCKLIWIKVYGCDGETYCGRVPENELPEFQQSKQPQKFDIQIKENKVEYVEFQANSVVTEKYNQITEYKGKMGCGGKLVWSELPALELNYIKELLDPDILNYLANFDLQKKDQYAVLEKELKKQIEDMMKAQKIIYL